MSAGGRLGVYIERRYVVVVVMYPVNLHSSLRTNPRPGSPAYTNSRPRRRCRAAAAPPPRRGGDFHLNPTARRRRAPCRRAWGARRRGAASRGRGGRRRPAVGFSARGRATATASATWSGRRRRSRSLSPEVRAPRRRCFRSHSRSCPLPRGEQPRGAAQPRRARAATRRSRAPRRRRRPDTTDRKWPSP